MGQRDRICKASSLLFLAWQRMAEWYFLQKQRKTDNAVPALRGYGIYAPSLPDPKLEGK